MNRLIDSNALDWSLVRPELTEGVSGKLLLDGATKMVLTRVVAGGVFRPHRDSYGHLFHVLSGEGLFRVAEQDYRLTAGMALQIEAAELHGYSNPGPDDLLLLSLNLPVPE